jgi:3-isopropylmalate/(R)-2-methylmalate dehydratase small subunit
VDLTTGLINDLTTGVKYQAQPLPAFMQELVAAGGLLPYLKTRAAAK